MDAYRPHKARRLDRYQPQPPCPGDLCKLEQLLVLEARFLRVRVPPGAPSQLLCYFHGIGHDFRWQTGNIVDRIIHEHALVVNAGHEVVYLLFKISDNIVLDTWIAGKKVTHKILLVIHIYRARGIGIVGNTPPWHGGISGSNPLSSTNNIEDAVGWFLHLFGKQAAGVSWPGFNSSFLCHKQQ